LEFVLEAGEGGMLIPAHAWTPHFSVFGAFSGFETLEECFGVLAPRVRAIETGLSSDPPMNRRVPALDGVALVSFSDAHSPAKLAREATEFAGEPSAAGMADAIETGAPDGLIGTIEFYPEEGKYHFDGHRACGVRLSPGETKQHGGRCPVCGGKITIGVLSRVEDLAARPAPHQSTESPRWQSLIPLQEILSKVLKVGPQSKKVTGEYFRLLAALGNELFILRDARIEALAETGGARFAEAVRRVRGGDVIIEPGFDGQFGKVTIFGEEA
jgi:uncharacterized protein (TIGR00375 family)